MPGSFPVFVTISDSHGQSTSTQATGAVTSANVPESIVASGAAGAFNTGMYGSGNTNTTSFNLGFATLTPVAPSASSGSGTTVTPTPTAAMMSVAPSPSIPTSVSYTSSQFIQETGTDWLLVESLGVSFVRKVTGNSSSGSFSDNLVVTISYFYKQTDTHSGTGWSQSLVTTQSDNTTIIENDEGTYTVSGSVVTLAGSYSTSQADIGSELLFSTSSSSGGGGSFLTESVSADDDYNESGVFRSTGNTTVDAGGSTYSSTSTASYTGFASSSSASGAATMNTAATDSGTSTQSYSEADTFQRSSGVLSDAGEFSASQQTTDSPSFYGASDSSAATSSKQPAPRPPRSSPSRVRSANQRRRRPIPAHSF